MKQLSVQLPATQARSYPILIGHGVLDAAAAMLPKSTKRLILADRAIAPMLLSKFNVERSFQAQLELVDSGEQEKDISSVQSLWQVFANHGLDRGSLLILIGGGVLGDMAGFAASTYMRGIRFVQIPTTLLSQVDASVGGKTGINFADTKNLIGAWNQPEMVVVELRMLDTLPVREFRAGLAEIIKHGLIVDDSLFRKFEIPVPQHSMPEVLENIVTRSIEIKAAVVAADEHEAGPRELLNFGHTLGHALEAHALKTASPLIHGEAVALGMMGEAFLSVRHAGLDSAALPLIENALRAQNLPTRIPHAASTEELLALMRRDKKNRAGEIRWVLLHSIGKASYGHVIPDSDIVDMIGHLAHG